VAVRAAIGLGSNLGDKAGNIERAIGRMDQLGAVTAVSTIYQSAPIGGPDQPPYYNAVVLLETDLEPRALLDGLLGIEQMQGRQRRERWGPRIIDLDVLLYGAEEIDDPGLIVPHPRMTERRFVLDPLLEVWPDAALPDGTPLRTKRAAVADQQVQPLAPVGVSPRTAGLVLFLTVGMLAVGIWWLLDWLLP
jgi:2-amino-4-hydroxy-6-hydroxymethyldihydropteridine diphosphokinase